MWYKEFLNKYKSGISHEFLFHFNVRDLVDNYRYFDRFLYEEFIKQRSFSLVLTYDISKGLGFFDHGMEREFNKITGIEAQSLVNMQPSKVFRFIDIVLKDTKTVLFIDHADKIIPSIDTGNMSMEERASLICLNEWSVNTKISATGSAIFLISDNIADISKEILKASYRVEPILVELPGETERRAYIDYLLEDKCIKTDISPEDFAKLSSGLSRKAIKDIKLRSQAEDIPISFLFIKEKKHSLLKKEYGDVLTFIYPEIGFEDIGGMSRAKNYLINNIVEPVLKGDLRRVPMGIMLCGPSGTGKTLLVNALAKASGFNCVKIDMSRILGQYVGESEKNFKKCLLGAQSQEPVIVFVDEIDTVFRRGDNGDNGVVRNIFSEFLQFAGNTANRGKVIFIAATNRPDLLDPALKRAGRFDRKIPILLPEANERAAIFDIMVKKYDFESNIEDYLPYAQLTENYTGAEIEVVVRKAYELTYSDEVKGNLLTEEILLSAIQRCRPNTKQIEFMTLLAVNECDDIDLISERYQALLEDKSALEDLIKSYGLKDKNG